MVKQKDLDFIENLIKGRVVEVLFEQMIRCEKKYTVIPFGYEHTTPTLSQYRKRLSEVSYILDNIALAPDFVLVSETRPELYVVEVKFRSSLDYNFLLPIAKKLAKVYPFAFLFVATPFGFFCDRCSLIAYTKKISPLPSSWVSLENQKKFLEILQKFTK